MTQLHSEQDAIKQAVEAGGYKFGRSKPHHIEYGPHSVSVYESEVVSHKLSNALILQDPAFWQALGKARGWEGLFCRRCGYECWNNESKMGEPVEEGGCAYWAAGNWIKIVPWKHHALRYFETVLSGGDLTKFWESLP